jgi:hypothetical protein
MPVLEAPVINPDIDFEVALLEERATIVHCTLTHFSAVRIWPSTFLVQEDGIRKQLLQAFNIAEYPEWKWLLAGQTFTLVFEGLDRSCVIFDLFEDIPEPGGFHIANIRRNKTDVYHLMIED